MSPDGDTHNGLNRYGRLIEKIFFDRYKEGEFRIEFERDDLIAAADQLDIKLPKNLGDVMYSLRYRNDMPQSILDTQPEGRSWIIEGVGRAKYAIRLVKMSRILPRPELVTISIPDGTPEIIRRYAQNDEQALLAIVRYNRLLDIFLSVTTYSLQSHLRSTVASGTQIEIDELYVGLDKYGCHYVIPVQAKGGTDQISAVQTSQDITWCSERYQGMKCRAISAQFMGDNKVALFELTIENDEVKVVDERHYKLVPADALDDAAIRDYR